MLKLDSISKSFTGKPVLKEISLEIGEGERFTLLGQSGCGKSTLLRLIAGFESPDKGKIWIEGKEVSSLPVEKRPVGLIFQNYALFPHMTVYDNIAVGPRIRKLPESEISKQIDELLEITHLKDLKSSYPQHISGGEAQRVALARAVINRPKILLLDEPLSALDPSLRQHLREELVEMQRALGITFLFVTHDQEEAMSVGTKMCIMEKGCIKQSGTPADLYERPESSFVATFLGEINCLSGSVEQKTGNLVILSLGDNGKIQFVSKSTDTKEQRCYVRPEKVYFDSGQEQKDPVNSLEGTLISMDFFGNYTRYQIKLKDGTHFKISLQHRKSKQHQYSIGESVRVLFAVSDVFQINEN
ncbi:MAG: ABC transporter ATP-binding protein [Nitrospina sp.]|jgi:ABC-type Fe3+/spermidine/putrescine transport system ATPase subunit|nr:ABC transporter ATP-binding protein [Nitrospina sp.]